MINNANAKGCWYYDTVPVCLQIYSQYTAFGVGRKYAMDALAMDANAKQAVEITNSLSTLCGHGVDVLELRKRHESK